MSCYVHLEVASAWLACLSLGNLAARGQGYFSTLKEILQKYKLGETFDEKKLYFIVDHFFELFLLRLFHRVLCTVPIVCIPSLINTRLLT